MILPLLRNRKLRIILALSLGIILFILLIIGTSYATVTYNASGRTYDNIDSIPHNRYGLLLATSPITPRGTHNYYFDFRIKAADELYKAGKIDYIIASGGDYRSKEKYGCDEPRSIHDSLVARGIPSERIVLDYDGTRTINSISKAKKAYSIDSITIISQKFHNERAIYQADHFGIHAIGYNAQSHRRRETLIRNILRESFARPKMFIDLLITDVGYNQIELPIRKEVVSNALNRYHSQNWCNADAGYIVGFKEDIIIALPSLYISQIEDDTLLKAYTNFNISWTYLKNALSDWFDEKMTLYYNQGRTGTAGSSYWSACSYQSAIVFAVYIESSIASKEGVRLFDEYNLLDTFIVKDELKRLHSIQMGLTDIQCYLDNILDSSHYYYSVISNIPSKESQFNETSKQLISLIENFKETQRDFVESYLHQTYPRPIDAWLLTFLDSIIKIGD